MVDRDLLSPRLLRTHVQWRAYDVTRDRQALLAFEASEAEVEDPEPAIFIENQVRWFDVSMDVGK